MNYKNGLGFISAFTVSLVIAIAPLTAATPTDGNVSNSTPSTGKSDTFKVTATSNGNVGINIPVAQASAIEDYWTPERMQKAKPLEIVPSNAPRPTTQIPQSSSKPVSVPGGDPSSSNLQMLREPLSTTQELTPTPVEYSYPFPYTRSFVSLSRYTQYPEKTVGKLFFTKNGVDRVCSASAINSTNKRLIWTAGHCVSDGEGNFATNVIFIPAYQPGTTTPEPYGRWSACGLYTRTAWHNGGDFSEDMGAIQACDQNGSPLHDVIGYLGFLANASRNQNFNAFGYPSDPLPDGTTPFDGNSMVTCVASYAVSDASTNPNSIGIGCDMTGGASGGPWLVNYTADSAGSVNQINGLNSYKYDNIQPEAMYSPYFGDAFLDLRDYAISQGS